MQSLVPFFLGLALNVCNVVLYLTFLLTLSFHFLNVVFLCLRSLKFAWLALFSLLVLLTFFFSLFNFFNGTAGLGSYLDFSQHWDYWGLQGLCFHFILLIPIFSEECELSHVVVALCRSAFHFLSRFLCIGCIQNLKSLLLLSSPSNNVY